MSKQFTQEFKEDAVRYYEEHKDLGITVCAKNLGTSRTALFDWIKRSKKIIEVLSTTLEAKWFIEAKIKLNQQ